MHIVQLLLHLGARVDIEVVIAALPESAQRLVSREAQRELAFAPGLIPSHPAREALLEDLDDPCRSGRAGFADQQVHMLGHEHEAHQRKAIARSHFLKNLDGKIPDAR